MERTGKTPIGRNVLFSILSGAAGTAGMDLLLYCRYRHAGGGDSVWGWEFAKGVKSWDAASAPGQVGRKLGEFLTQRPLPDSWARSTTNLVHWATGAGWGLQYGLLANKMARPPWMLGLSLGPAAWLSGYIVLPFAKIYKPIWDYDATTLTKDLSAHLLYGVATGMTYVALTRQIRNKPA